MYIKGEIATPRRNARNHCKITLPLDMIALPIQMIKKSNKDNNKNYLFIN